MNDQVFVDAFERCEIANWIALYVAAGLCCGIAVILSVATTFIEIYRERAWTNIDSFGSAALFLPKTWWRWQKLYFISTPVTLGIVGAFAASMSWS